MRRGVRKQRPSRESRCFPDTLRTRRFRVAGAPALGVAVVTSDDAVSLPSGRGSMLVRLGRWAVGFAGQITPWTDVYGLARTLLALGTAGTILFNPSTTLFGPLRAPSLLRPCFGPAAFSCFCLVSPPYQELTRWAAGLGLLVVASGWRPRYTGVLHWWLSYSFALSAVTIDGGDQIAAALALLLLPVTLTDARRWHWQSAPAGGGELRGTLMRLLAIAALLAVRVQVAGVYFHAAIAKFSVEEWRDGTAFYYWLGDPVVGARGWVGHVMGRLLEHDVTAPILTWGAIAIEVFLFMALTMPKKAWGFALGVAIPFHLLIAVFFGLTSFSLAMLAADVLYLRPVEREFGIARLLLSHGPLRSARAPVDSRTFGPPSVTAQTP